MQSKIYTDIYDDKILPFFDFIKTELDSIGKKIFTYKSKLNFKQMFYILTLANASNNSSYAIAVNDAISDNIVKGIIPNTITKKRKKCMAVEFENLNKRILDKIYLGCSKRLLATDGTGGASLVELSSPALNLHYNFVVR